MKERYINLVRRSMMDINYVKERLLHGESTVGVIINIGCAPLVEIIGLSAYDYILFDMEHGPISEETLGGLVHAAKCSDLVPLARVRENNPKLILQALDLGTCGVMVPQIETEEEARAAVNAAMYWPLGRRGLSSFTPAGLWGKNPVLEHIRRSNINTVLILQIETKKGLENVRSIAKVEGVDALLVGPSDLSQALGCPGEFDGSVLQEAIETVIHECRAAEVASGALIRNREEAYTYYKKGVRFFITGILGALVKASQEQAASFKKVSSECECLSD